MDFVDVVIVHGVVYAFGSREITSDSSHVSTIEMKNYYHLDTKQNMWVGEKLQMGMDYLSLFMASMSVVASQNKIFMIGTGHLLKLINRL